ncbi:MAG: hypothetical protein J5379_05610 [Clostridiales bacterium]|nr:hypothetical protein [Clostridiales bacterium]
MVTLCPNCSAPVVFDPKTQKVICHSCSGSWDPQEFDLQKESVDLEETNADVSDIDDEDVAAHFLDAYVYHCPSCGGEINVNGTESSTKCIYCGNPSIVFNRIEKEKAPEYIIPFTVTREEAIEKIRQSLKGRLLVPKVIKNLNPDMVRGIYVPYWLVNGRHLEGAVVRSYIPDRSSDGSTKPYYWGRAGMMQLRNLPVDGSKILSDDSSQQLEPYDLSAIQPFAESYLLGFYSNASDITYKDLTDAAEMRAVGAFHDQAAASVSGANPQVVCWEYETVIDENIYYAMFPVWFVSYDYDGQHNIIMVNGQTGKVVGAIPWKKKKLTWVTAILTALFSIPLTMTMYYFIELTHQEGEPDAMANLGLVFFPLLLGFVTIAMASGKKKLVDIHLKMSQASSIFHFAKKRQE